MSTRLTNDGPSSICPQPVLFILCTALSLDMSPTMLAFSLLICETSYISVPLTILPAAHLGKARLPALQRVVVVFLNSSGMLNIGAWKKRMMMMLVMFMGYPQGNFCPPAPRAQHGYTHDV